MAFTVEGPTSWWSSRSERCIALRLAVSLERQPSSMYPILVLASKLVAQLAEYLVGTTTPWYRLSIAAEPLPGSTEFVHPRSSLLHRLTQAPSVCTLCLKSSLWKAVEGYPFRFYPYRIVESYRLHRNCFKMWPRIQRTVGHQSLWIIGHQNRFEIGLQSRQIDQSQKKHRQIRYLVIIMCFSRKMTFLKI